jgi:hypothetical protein
VHVAEISEAAGAAAVQRAEGGDEAVALGRGQGLRVLADADSDASPTEHAEASGAERLDHGVTETDARAPEFPGHEEANPRPADGQVERQSRRAGTRACGRERDATATGRAGVS